jgi:hypothetical protein
MTDKEALKLALEALDSLLYWDNGKPEYDEAREAITAIKQALAAPVQDASKQFHEWAVSEHATLTTTPPAAQLAPVQEPVAWIADTKRGYNTVGYECKKVNALPHGTMLYTTPPAAKPAVPDAIIEAGESPDYRDGWNDCRQTMLEMLKGRSQ